MDLKSLSIDLTVFLRENLKLLLQERSVPFSSFFSYRSSFVSALSLCHVSWSNCVHEVVKGPPRRPTHFHARLPAHHLYRKMSITSRDDIVSALSTAASLHWISQLELSAFMSSSVQLSIDFAVSNNFLILSNARDDYSLNCCQMIPRESWRYARKNCYMQRTRNRFVGKYFVAKSRESVLSSEKERFEVSAKKKRTNRLQENKGWGTFNYWLLIRWSRFWNPFQSPKIVHLSNDGTWLAGDDVLLSLGPSWWRSQNF